LLKQDNSKNSVEVSGQKGTECYQTSTAASWSTMRMGKRITKHMSTSSLVHTPTSWTRDQQVPYHSKGSCFAV